MITELTTRLNGCDYLTLKCDLCGRVLTERPANVYTDLKRLAADGWHFSGHFEGSKCTCPECGKY